jgi:hypothetical protein
MYADMRKITATQKYQTRMSRGIALIASFSNDVKKCMKLQSESSNFMMILISATKLNNPVRNISPLIYY